MKPTVHYRRASLLAPPVVGHIAYLQTLDHPSPRVTNWPAGPGVMTSRIIRVEEDGLTFETENTLYKPEVHQ